VSKLSLDKSAVKAVAGKLVGESMFYQKVGVKSNIFSLGY
jgi:hypothetical protein